MTIRLIYNTTKDGNVIGNKGKLAAYIPEDLKRFKELTTGGVVVMGYNTYASLPGKQRPLKDRINIVLSRDPNLKLHNVKVYHSINSAIQDYNDKDIWIIGGGEILKQTISLADEIKLTLVHNKLSGDITSPEIPLTDWKVVHESEIFESGMFKYQYIDYRRN